MGKKSDGVDVVVVKEEEVEIVIEDEQKKNVKDMLSEPVAIAIDDDKVQSAQEQMSEKIMNDFANIAIESGMSSKVNVDVNGNENVNNGNVDVGTLMNGNEKSEDDVVDLLNMNVDEI